MFVPRKGLIAFYRPFLDPKDATSLFFKIKKQPEKKDDNENKGDGDLNSGNHGEEHIITPVQKYKEPTERKEAKGDTYVWDHSKCLKTKTIDQRMDYCENIFGNEEQVKNCYNKFCDYCCNSVYRNLLLFNFIFDLIFLILIFS